jgi:hypothetical protein
MMPSILLVGVVAASIGCATAGTTTPGVRRDASNAVTKFGGQMGTGVIQITTK